MSLGLPEILIVLVIILFIVWSWAYLQDRGGNGKQHSLLPGRSEGRKELRI